MRMRQLRLTLKASWTITPMCGAIIMTIIMEKAMYAVITGAVTIAAGNITATKNIPLQCI